MLLSQFLIEAQKRLAAAGIDNPSLDARLLVAAGLKTDRVGLLTGAARTLTEAEQAALESLIARRAAREPVGRILGRREFWGLSFALNEATLEPRPDSETLIETALRLWPSKGEAGQTPPLTPPQGEGNEAAFSEPLSPRVLDLGTGTGCLLLAMLSEWPSATGLGIDLSPRAVAQAQANAQALGLADRAQFRTGDWLEGVTGPFDLILSNPPYIPDTDIKSLDPEVRDHDPLAALAGGPDGLAPYRHLAPRLPAFLRQGGLCLFEIGHDQGPAVARLMTDSGFTQVQTHQDLGGNDRCVSGINI